MYKKVIYFLFLLVYGNISAGDNQISQQVRGLWVVRHDLTSPEKIDSLIQLSRKCNFTDLFVQIRGRGDAFYISKYESKAEQIIDKNFDPLGYLLEQTRNDTIRIHAWLNVFYVWSKDTLPGDQNHIVHQRRHWLAWSNHYSELISDYPNSVKKSKIEGLYVSPLHPEAQQYFLDIVQDILQKYKLYGIHLDYIRYPDQSFDVNPDVVRGFKNRFILNPQQFLSNPEVFAQKFSIAGYEVFYHHWRRYLKDGLSDFVKTISENINEKFPEVLLTAAVKPDIFVAHWNYYQDWDRWVKEGWLDYAIPMNYAANGTIFKKRIENYLENLDLDEYAVGISLYNQSAEQAIRKIAQVRALNNVGYLLFSYQQLKELFLIQKYLGRKFIDLK
jgi:uncharacterized lipoprotein YddW (UPF0748 family)